MVLVKDMLFTILVDIYSKCLQQSVSLLSLNLLKSYY